MKLITKAYVPAVDYWRIRHFLRTALLAYDYRERCWPLYRFEYWSARLKDMHPERRLEELVYLWETEAGEIAAFLCGEDKGEAFLNVLPEFRSRALDQEMIAAAEMKLSLEKEDGRRSLIVWANGRDEPRRELLGSLGYRRLEEAEHQRRRSMAVPIPECPPPPGFTVRSLGDGLELLERCYASGWAFHPNEPQIAIENRVDVSWYRSIQRAPMYRRDLDIVAVDPNGAIASFCTVWFDDVARTGAFEPVGTPPAYQRKGLGKAVMAEGLRRLSQMGALWAYVASYSPGAHALYASMGFTDCELQEPWKKEW